jgi:hypothetical protein
MACAEPPGALPGLGDDLPPTIRQALLGLRHSRLALRQEMVPPARLGGGAASGPGEGWQRWWRRLRRWPAGRWVRAAAQQWWHAHPLHPLGDTLVGEARSQLLPLVRRHPWATAGVVVAAGAGLVALRPWRWGWVDAHVRRAPAVAGRWLWEQARSAPVQAALASLLWMTRQRPSSDPGQPSEAAHAASASSEPQGERHAA